MTNDENAVFSAVKELLDRFSVLFCTLEAEEAALSPDIIDAAQNYSAAYEEARKYGILEKADSAGIFSTGRKPLADPAGCGALNDFYHAAALSIAARFPRVVKNAEI